MRKINKLLPLTLAIALSASLFISCGTKTDEKYVTTANTGHISSAKLYIPIISKGFQNQFWQAVKTGAEKAAKDLNVEITFEGPESEMQIDKQIKMLEAALAKKPAAICLAVLDSKAVLPLLEKAESQNIPVVCFDSGIDRDIPITTVATDNIAAAALAADKMAELVGKEGEVAVIVHDQISRTGVDRRDGFLNRMKESYPNIKIVDIQYGKGDHLISTAIAKTMIQAHPNLKGIFGANEGSAIGALNGVTEMKMDGKIIVIGYDAGKQQKEAIRTGKMAGAITQDPVGIGYKAVEAAVKAAKGEKIDKEIYTGFYWYDKTNIDSEELKLLLYD